jgi:hypothetical protein
MKIRVTRIALATSVALATLIGGQAANAQPRHQAGEAYDAESNPNYGFGPRVTIQPNDAVAGNKVIGRDPDPFIRDQLLRDYNSGRPD